MSGGTLSTYYVLLVGAIISSFMVLAHKDLRPCLDRILESIKGQREPTLWDDNVFIMTPRLLSIMFFFPTVSYLLVEIAGASAVVPDFGSRPIWEMFYGFANASVWEELILRVMFLGIPLGLYCTIQEGWKPRMLEGFGKVTRSGFFFLLFSSLMFAMAHAYGGWDMYKVPPTFFTGMALGYAFLKRGLPGAIILHFTLDFFTMAAWVEPRLWAAVEVGFFIMVLAGAYYTLKYIMEVWQAATGSEKKERGRDEDGRKDISRMMNARRQVIR